MVDDMSMEYTPGMEDKTKIYLRDIALGEKDTFAYLCEFGDSWSHESIWKVHPVQSYWILVVLMVKELAHRKTVAVSGAIPAYWKY